MAAERPPFQDRVRDGDRQQSGFVSRQGQVIQYQESFGFPVDVEQRRFLFKIHGDAGVGKIYLTKRLQQIATSADALTANVDETVEDVTSAITVIAEQFARDGARLGEFEVGWSWLRQTQLPTWSGCRLWASGELTKV
jgi:hypothetical protein